jgi:Plasmid pRiA4b ORF-3-like protein
VSRYSQGMESILEASNIYQLRIVLRDMSPLVWRRILVRDDTTLAQLHDIIQVLFDWQDEHLHDFHIFGKDYGTNGADTQATTLSQFRLRKGERFRYIYDYYAYWVCDIRLEAILPVDLKRFYPVCTGGKNASPSENFEDVQAYMTHIDQHLYDLPVEAMSVVADALKIIAQMDSNASVQEVLGDLSAIREAANELEAYRQADPSRFHRSPINQRLIALSGDGDNL